jgi:hypothetical protein
VKHNGENEGSNTLEEALTDALTDALVRRPAPPGLKGRILAERRRRIEARHGTRSVAWMRLAASLALVGILAGAGAWQWRRVQAQRSNEDERRRGEEARRQVMTALGITARALDHVEMRLEARNRNPEE